MNPKTRFIPAILCLSALVVAPLARAADEPAREVVCQAECWGADLGTQYAWQIDPAVRVWGTGSRKELLSQLRDRCPGTLGHSRLVSASSESSSTSEYYWEEHFRPFWSYSYGSSWVRLTRYRSSIELRIDRATPKNSCRPVPAEIREIDGERVGG